MFQRASLWILASVLWSLPAGSQELPLEREYEPRFMATYDEQYADGQYFRKLRPEEIPDHTLVYNLLHHGSLWMEREPVPKSYHQFLKEIGLEPGSAAADAFTYAVLDAREVIRAEAKKRQDALEHQEWQVTRLAAIYARLLLKLEAWGQGEVIGDFIDSDIRPGTSVMVMDREPMGDSLPDMERMRSAFDRELTRVRARGARRGDEEGGQR